MSCKAYRAKLTPIAKLIKTINFLVFHAVLPYQAQIEPDLILEHYGLGVVVHPNVKIGKRCRIYHNVTLAAEVPLDSKEGITIGDDVLIGAGAVVIGRGYQSLTIGNGCKIGAGAVVTKSVEDGLTVVGSPARPVQKG